VPLPENRAALLAIERVFLQYESHSEAINPLFLHGPPGTGKSHLVSALVERTCQGSTSAVISLAGDFVAGALPEDCVDQEVTLSDPAFTADLWILEDLQQLPPRSAGRLAQIIDFRLAHDLQMVFTASVPPVYLRELPARVLSRLVGGLVIAIEPPSQES